MYKRYVDDTYMIFRTENHVLDFFDYINSKHKNIHFTIEQELGGRIPFLDMMIAKKDGKLDFSVYRKPTFTGLGVNFLSECYTKYKINSIKTLVYRAYNLSSSFLNFHLEIEVLRNYFKENGFNANIFYRIVNSFLSSRYQTNKEKSYGPEKKMVYARFPFLSNDVNKLLLNGLKRIIETNVPHINLRLAFFNNHKIKSYFRNKDTLPVAMRSLVVYCFTCAKCSLAYIGSTKKMLSLRVDEHQGISSRTGRPLKQPGYSAVREHCENTCKISFNFNYFKILSSCQSEIELRLTETLFIRTKKPALNVDNGAFNLKIF